LRFIGSLAFALFDGLLRSSFSLGCPLGPVDACKAVDPVDPACAVARLCVGGARGGQGEKR
jgi:hypothetical protein